VDRRAFLGSLAAGLPAAARGTQSQATSGSRTQTPGAASTDDRPYWIATLRRLADPVLTNLARMPVEQAPGADRSGVTRLEALGRVVAGIAPWLELGEDAAMVAHVRDAIARAVDPSSPDALNFTRDRQPLVDTAFLAQGVLRAPRALGDGLDAPARRRLIAALESTRPITPGFNNWLLFSATIEACLKSIGASWDRTRVDYALRQHEQWYKGDGAYGDGPEFHWDYYNSFVMHPMLVDVLDAVSAESPEWKALAGRERVRAKRYAAIQERLIASDGSFPAIGRSIAYRCGAFHLLAQSALRGDLPDGVSPAQVRGALTAVIRRTLDAPGAFDANGWLRIGLCGHQPGIGEPYISTGSLYLCATALLPLGLPASNGFWSAAPQPWTSAKAWSGAAFPIDHAL
jgi:hypothetical protein